MSIEDDVLDTSTPSEDTASEGTLKDIAPDDKGRLERDIGPKSIRENLKAAFEEQKREPSKAKQEAAARRAREEDGKFAREAEKPNGGAETKAAPTTNPAPAKELTPSSTTEAQPASAPAAADPPTSWSKEAKIAWASLPAQVQQAVAKREKEVADGFAQYQTRYREIDQAITPQRRAMLQQLGRSEGDAVNHLFGWFEALSDPRRQADAFRALAQSHGINIATLAQTSAGHPQQQTELNPAQLFQSYLAPIRAELNALKQERAREIETRVNGEIAGFAKDKPHFERVRAAMGQMLGSGYATSLDDAYQKATWADPEIRSEILAEEAAKREADLKAAAEAEKAKAAEAEKERKRKEAEAAEKARRANVSPKTGTPLGSAPPKAKRGMSVRESLKEVIAEHRAS